MAPIPSGARVIPRRSSPIILSTGQRHLLALEKSSIFVVGLEGLCFHTDREILLPDPEMEDGDPRADRVTSITLAKAVIEHAARLPSFQLLVAGHTDTTGKRAPNLALSERRAENTHLFLSGRKAEWAAHSQKNVEVGDWQHILKWIACTRGWDCDPGPVDGDAGPKSRQARHAFRSLYNDRYGGALPLEGGIREQDWTAFFDVFDTALAEILGTGLAGLQARRAALEFLPERWVGCGEEWPVEAVGLDGYASEDNRRVEVLFVPKDDPPDLERSPPGADLYDGHRYRSAHLPVMKVKGRLGLWVRLPLSAQRAREVADGFVLTSSDGLQEIRVPNLDAIPAGEYTDLLFTGLLKSCSYTLQCRSQEGKEGRVIFENVPYDQLGALSATAASRSVPDWDPDEAGTAL